MGAMSRAYADFRRSPGRLLRESALSRRHAGLCARIHGENDMKTKIISGSALAAAAFALALNGAAVAPAHAHASSTHAKAHCGGKGTCHHKAKCHHKSQCHHHKGHCNMKSKCHTR
jgi:hypothetical protein